jgi:uncharacterized protein (DUF2141 family)
VIGPNKDNVRGLLPHAARLSGIACAVLFGARCAHMEPPSGGPADTTPPAVVAVYPAPDALGVPPDTRLVFAFSEWLDRNAARNQVLISPPYPGRARLEVDGDRLIVRTPAGTSLRPNTTHTVTVLGTLKDLRGNLMGRGFSLRFSTGGALDSASVAGRLGLDGRRGQLLVALYRTGDRSGIEALSPRDTGFRPGVQPEPWREVPAFLAAADSTGRFRLESAAPGDYALFAFEDVNGNFAFDLGLEAAAMGTVALPLRPRAADQALRLAPLDTLPLRIAEAAFEADAPVDSAGGLLTGFIRLTFTRPPHPARATEAGRYRILPDSGAAVPVRGAGWSPEKNALILETPPFRPNARLRVEMRGRPDFPGRPGGTDTDTSVSFTVEASANPPVWTVSPALVAGTAGPSGLPAAQTSPPPGAVQNFASNLPLTAERWSSVERRLGAYAGKDTLPLPFRAQRVNATAFTMTLSRPLRAGDALELRLRPAPGDSAPPRLLYAGRAADSSQAGGLKFRAPSRQASAGADRVYWLRNTITSAEHTLIRSGDSLKALNLPVGYYRLLAFGDRDGDGVQDAGALKPWIPQEPFETLLDSVTVTPGVPVDVTGRLTP